MVSADDPVSDESITVLIIAGAALGFLAAVLYVRRQRARSLSLFAHWGKKTAAAKVLRSAAAVARIQGGVARSNRTAMALLREEFLGAGCLMARVF